MRYSEDDYDDMKRELEDDIEMLRADIVAAGERIFHGNIMIVVLVILCLYFWYY